MAEADQAQGETRVCPTCGSNDPTLCRNDDDHSPLNRGGSFGHPHGEYPAKCCPDTFHLPTPGQAGSETEYASQEEMRFGPRSYTPEQAEVIEQAVRERQPLPEPPLPVDAGRAGSEGEHPIVEAIEYEEEPGRVGTESPWKTSYFWMRDQRDAALERVSEGQRECDYQTDRANYLGNILLWLWQALDLDDKDDAETLAEYLNRWPRDKVGEAILGRVEELVDRSRELEGAIDAFLKWFEQTFPSDGNNLPGITLFSIAERARAAGGTKASE